jgi:hypothetical protein
MISSTLTINTMTNTPKKSPIWAADIAALTIRFVCRSGTAQLSPNGMPITSA